jgi:hypothetical protein
MTGILKFLDSAQSPENPSRQNGHRTFWGKKKSPKKHRARAVLRKTTEKRSRLRAKIAAPIFFRVHIAERG